MNEFAAAAVELFDANDEACGTPQFVFIDGKKKRAIISEVTTDIIEALGGKADAGGFACQCLASEFSEQPEKGDRIQKMGKGDRFEVLSVRSVNDATYDVVAGDPSADQR